MLIRHGATQWSVSGRHTGRTDIALTSKGREQAQVTAVGIRSLLGNEFDFVRVFTSPLQRATETASIVIGPGIPVTRDENLLEFNYGEYEGLTLEEIQTRRPGWNLWIDGCPGGETAHQVGERADTFSLRSRATMAQSSSFRTVTCYEFSPLGTSALMPRWRNFLCSIRRRSRYCKIFEEAE